MRQWRMGTLTLGSLLVALGCGFILTKLGIINSIVHVLSWWPLAIILLGIEVLLGGFLFIDERCKLKFDGFSVLSILLTLFICASSFVVSALPIDKFNFNFPHSNIFYSDNSTFKKSLTINASRKENFIINNSLGNIQFQKSTGTNIEIEASVKIAYNDYEFAKSVPDNIIKITEGNITTLSSDKAQFDNNKVNIESIDYTIKVPDKINVEIINKFGNVDAVSIGGNLKINNTNGNVNVKTIAGTLTIENRFGDINASEVSGTAKITNSNGKIIANSFNSNLVIESKFSDIATSNIKGNLELTDTNGKINVENITGSLIMQNKFGDIEIKNAAGIIDVKNENGAIALNSDKIIQNEVKFVNKFGNITLNLNNQQEGQFKLYTRHGNIKTSLPMSINKDNTAESADSIIGNGKNQFNIKNDSGNISINKN